MGEDVLAFRKLAEAVEDAVRGGKQGVGLGRLTQGKDRISLCLHLSEVDIVDA